MSRSRACWMTLFVLASSVGIMAAQPGGCDAVRLTNAAGQSTDPSDCLPDDCPLVQALDADDNDELSAEEIADAATLILALDTNGDGLLTPDELCPVDAAGAADGDGGDPCSSCPDLLLQALDTDEDGTLSEEEIGRASCRERV